MLAYIWGYPLMDMYRLRDYYTAGPRPGGLNSPINQFTHARVLMDDKYTGGQYPNIDTLHSSVWLDLAKEPERRPAQGRGGSPVADQRGVGLHS
jgi:hypothetical protein